MELTTGGNENEGACFFERNTTEELWATGLGEATQHFARFNSRLALPKINSFGGTKCIRRKIKNFGKTTALAQEERAKCINISDRRLLLLNFM
jgi:hypothetical protein